jgi:hypothetical protein
LVTRYIGWKLHQGSAQLASQGSLRQAHEQRIIE